MLTAVDEEGVTYRDTLEGLIKRTSNTKKRAGYEAELQTPSFPPALSYLWTIYGRLRRRAGSNGYSANPIGWQDIDAFLRRSGQQLAPWEIALIEAVDDLFLSSKHPPE